MENIKQTSDGFFLTDIVAKLWILRRGRRPRENQEEGVLPTANDGLFRASVSNKRNQRINGSALLVKQAMTVKV